MRIDVLDLQSVVKIDKKGIKRLAEKALKALGEGEETELSLLFVDNSYIRRLNKKYRGVNSNTDVLAFAMREGHSFPKKGFVLGDVVISAETAKRESKKRKIPLRKEISLYLVHGILHLLGYDDETLGQKKRMRAKEKELLGVL